MTEQPYTDADVKLVAATFIAEAKKNPIEPGTPPWLGAQTRWLLGPTEHDIARAVLDALAAAGRLKPPTTEDQIRAGADALVRLRTLAPSLSELDKEEQAFWRRDAVAVLEAAGPLAPGDDEPTRYCHNCGHACAHNPPHPLIDTPNGPVCKDQDWCRQLQHADKTAKSCPCLPGAPPHVHGAGGYSTAAETTAQTQHVIGFNAVGTWTIDHPDTTCWVDGACRVRQLAERQITSDLAQLMAGGRYACSVGEVGDVFQLDERLHDDQCTTPVCAACGCWCHAEEQPTGPTADHPHTDPGDGRTECGSCGKYVWPVIHSCKGVPVTDRARARAEPPCRDCGQREADHVDGRCPRYRSSAGRVDQAEG